VCSASGTSTALPPYFSPSVRPGPSGRLKICQPLLHGRLHTKHSAATSVAVTCFFFQERGLSSRVYCASSFLCSRRAIFSSLRPGKDMRTTRSTIPSQGLVRRSSEGDTAEYELTFHGPTGLLCVRSHAFLGRHATWQKSLFDKYSTPVITRAFFSPSIHIPKSQAHSRSSVHRPQ
jgi:hypothetical protein